jgi:hypothetical protein
MTLPGGGGGILGATGSPNPATTETIFDDDDLATYVTSYEVGITATGGTAPYTYAWTYVSGSTAISCLAPSASSTAFAATIYRGSSRGAVWRCTITDSAAASVTVDISVELER